MESSLSAAAELRVLVVDDNVDAATTLCYLLQMLGCKTAVAYGGTTGLRVAQLFKPGLVFLDLDMPDGDGCTVLRALRELEPALPPALFVCLTGRSEPEDEQRCLAAGFDAFQTKPMPPETLACMLEQAKQAQVLASLMVDTSSNVPPSV